MLVNLYLSLALLSGNGDAIARDTTIIGKAQNAKYGALLTSSNEQSYYIDRLDAWPDSIIGKTVEVTGRLKQKKIKAPKKDEEIKGSIMGPIKILLKPRWKLLD